MKKLIFTALLSLSLVSQEQNIFYKDADIKTFAQDIALLTDKTIILDPRVKGVISIYSDAPLDSESIWEVFISTMEVQGYNVLKDGNIYTVRTREYIQTGEVLFGDASFALLLEPWKEIEIDTKYDFIIAQALAKEYINEQQ